jgi:glycine cleavage system H protein
MSAGLVAYKLCDLRYDCERCRFDAVMRGESPAKTSRAFRSPRRVSRGFPHDRQYDDRHVWIRAAPKDHPGLFQIGIDAFAAWLVRSIAAVVAPACRSRLERGGPAAWLRSTLGMIAINSPLDGTVVALNPALSSRPQLAIDDPYGKGWLLEIASTSTGKALAHLRSGPEMKALARAHRTEIARIVATEACRVGQLVGATLPDGGQRVGNWRDTLSSDRARWILRRFLG